MTNNIVDRDTNMFWITHILIISTNCSEEDLAKKYTPQICSRIAGEFIALPFVGQDIRKLKRGI